MFGPLVAALLCQRGIDAVSAIELGRVGVPDAVHLLLAAQEGRCVATRDYPDFARETIGFMEQMMPHAGVVLVPPSLRTQDLGPLVEALARFAMEHPDGLPPYSVLWLRPAWSP